MQTHDSVDCRFSDWFLQLYLAGPKPICSPIFCFVFKYIMCARTLCVFNDMYVYCCFTCATACSNGF